MSRCINVLIAEGKMPINYYMWNGLVSKHRMIPHVGRTENTE
jgi:hypothetical protein